MEGFEVFKRSKRGTTQTDPKITVSSGGNVTLNAPALGLIGHTPTYMQLLFNKDARQIALNPTDEKDGDGYKLRGSSHTSSRVIGAKAFFDHYGILPKESIIRDVEQLGTYLVFSLDEKALESDAPEETAAPARGRARR